MMHQALHEEIDLFASVVFCLFFILNSNAGTSMTDGTICNQIDHAHCSEVWGQLRT